MQPLRRYKLQKMSSSSSSQGGLKGLIQKTGKLATDYLTIGASAVIVCCIAHRADSLTKTSLHLLIGKHQHRRQIYVLAIFCTGILSLNRGALSHVRKSKCQAQKDILVKRVEICICNNATGILSSCPSFLVVALIPIFGFPARYSGDRKS